MSKLFGLNCNREIKLLKIKANYNTQKEKV